MPGVARYRCTSQGPPTVTSVCGCHQGVKCAGCCQIEMHITGASYCDFCVWLPSGSKVCQVLSDTDAHHRGLLLRLLCVAAIRE